MPMIGLGSVGHPGRKLLATGGLAKGGMGGHEGQQLEAELRETGGGQGGPAVIFGHRREVAFRFPSPNPNSVSDQHKTAMCG
jgi:hypothetical protein